MKVLIVGLIVLAFGVAGVSTYLIKSFSSDEAIEELKEEAAPVKTKVLISGKSIKAGETLQAGDLKWQEWPEEILNPKYIVSDNEKSQETITKKHAGSVARMAITEGEPILPEKLFSRKKAGFMAGMLSPGMRAVSIKITVNTGVAGFILPNDRVDVLLVHDKIREVLKDQEKEQQKLANENKNGDGGELQRPQEFEQPPAGVSLPLDQQDPMWFLRKNLGPFIFISKTTETILRNIRVIAINQAVTPPEGQSIQAKTVTLELTPNQAEIITAAESMGKLSLVLRGIGPQTAEDEPDEPSSTTDVEVSPLLGKFKRDYMELNARMAKLRAEQAAEMERQRRLEEEAARLRDNAPGSSIIAPMKPLPKAPKKAKKVVKKPVMKIYRGGAAETEEIQTK